MPHLVLYLGCKTVNVRCAIVHVLGALLSKVYGQVQAGNAVRHPLEI